MIRPTFFSLAVRLTSLVVTLIGWSMPTVAQETSPNTTFSFSVGWRVEGPYPENVVQLGVVYTCGRKWCADFEEFRGSLNLPRVPLDVHHEMAFRTGATGCKDERLRTVYGKRSKETFAILKKSGTGYIIHVGGRQYIWSRDESKAGGYILEAIQPANRPDVFHSQPVGYAYWSRDLRGLRFERDSYNAYFDGYIAHKDAHAGAKAEWKLGRTSIDFRRMNDSQQGSPVLSLTQAGHPDVLKRMKKPVEVQHSVLSPAYAGERLRFFNHEYGHDFNANGCFDEFGHNKLMLPVVEELDVEAFVFVEYTYDKYDKVPLLSVGRYFRKR